MIRYALACDNGHEFEGWFGSSDEFEQQQAVSLLECPFCASQNVEKMLMAPSVSTSRKREAALSAPPDSAQPEGGAGEPLRLTALSNEQRAIVAQMRELKEKLLSAAEDVGEKFSEEARKIHYGEAEKRGIYGKASLEEAADLAEEGIDFLPLPDLPDDRN